MRIFCNFRTLLPVVLTMVSTPVLAQEYVGPQISTLGTATAECFYNAEGEFVLNGDFDTQASVCFRNTYEPGTSVIRINSRGGQNAIGLSLAHMLKDENFHLIIEGRCNSACAQYIIPLAKELTLRDGAGVVIHGVMSDYHLSKPFEKIFINREVKMGKSHKEAQIEYNNFKKYAKIQIATAEKFRIENNVGRGWFMQQGTWSESADGMPVSVIDVEWLKNKPTNGLLIDQKFLETCLPDVKINKFIGPSNPKSVGFPGYANRIENAGVIALPEAHCI